MENNTGIENTENAGDLEDEEAEIEQEMDAAEEVAADSQSVPSEGKPKATPAYATFLEGLKRHASALGLAMKDQKGFFQFCNGTTGHKLYVAKQGKEVSRVDTTLPADQLGDLAYDLEKPNGRIACHVKADPDAVALALDVLANYGEKIRAPKRQSKAESATQS